MDGFKQLEREALGQIALQDLQFTPAHVCNAADNQCELFALSERTRK